tara:strand:+ start:2023 stop:2613 length:591 start_codon:yes stop_codon:yes gene_type:complete
MKKCVNIISLFTSPPKPPFSIDLTLNLPNSTVDKLYEYIKSIYIGGLAIIIDKDTKSNTVLLSNITEKHITLMHQYMLSIGIETYFHMYTPEQLDVLYRDFLYVVGKIENIGLQVVLDWKKQHILKIAMELNKLTNHETKHFLSTIQNYNKVNIFFGFFKPVRLKDFGFKVKNNDDIYLVYFDFADRGKYETKYKI